MRHKYLRGRQKAGWLCCPPDIRCLKPRLLLPRVGAADGQHPACQCQAGEAAQATDAVLAVVPVHGQIDHPGICNKTERQRGLVSRLATSCATTGLLPWRMWRVRSACTRRIARQASANGSQRRRNGPVCNRAL